MDTFSFFDIVKTELMPASFYFGSWIHNNFDNVMP